MRCIACLLFCVICFQISAQVKAQKDIVYGKGADWNDQQQDLTLDLYTPPSGRHLPLILFMHGGSFIAGDKAPISGFCAALAEKGFVVANINYRLGFDTSASKRAIGVAMANYRAAQDQAAALRFLVHNSKDYHIDTQNVFIAGESAGAVTSLENGFMSQSDWDSIVPLLHQQLGELQNSGNDLKENYSIKGIISLWGGIVDTTLISAAESKEIPILLIQSQSDEAIPYEHAKNKGVVYSGLYGSYDIASRYNNAGSCATLLYTKNAKHYFGFSQHYVVQAMQQFVNYVMAGKCQSKIEENIGGDNSIPFSRYQ